MFLDNKLLKFDENFHITRSASKGCMFIPQIKTTNFGIKSLRYSAAVLWNNFIKCNEVNDIRNIGLFKKYLKVSFLSLYKEN